MDFPGAADKNDNECRQNTPFATLQRCFMNSDFIILRKLSRLPDMDDLL
jgi:hypothetical protein